MTLSLKFYISTSLVQYTIETQLHSRHYFLIDVFLFHFHILLEYQIISHNYLFQKISYHYVFIDLPHLSYKLDYAILRYYILI